MKYSSPEERLVMVRERVQNLGAVRIDELAADFGVSEMTIRRDLDELEILGEARRVRGGAVAVGPEPFSQRHRHNARAKTRIAEKLLTLVPASGTLALDASTTVYRLAVAIDGARDLTVVTNGPDAFGALTGKPGVTALLTGGTREPRTDSLVGPVAARTAQSFAYDIFVCSGAALDPVLGSSEASLAEADVKRAFGSTSTRIVLAADRSKLDTRSQARMFSLSDVDLLVTELDPGDSRFDEYRGAVDIL